MAEVGVLARPAWRARVVTATLLVLVAVAGTGLRWWDPWDSRATFDSLQYARIAYAAQGQRHAAAEASAVRLRCREWARVRPAPGWFPVSLPRPTATYAAQCARPGYRPGVSPTYESIFDARPGYPDAVAALSPVLGDRAFGVVAVGSGGLAVLLVGLAGLLLGIGRWPAVVAEAAVLVLPSGLYLTRLGPDGLVGLGLGAALCGALLAVGHRRLGWGIGLLAAGLLVLVAAKQPDAVALGAALALPAAWVARRPGPVRRPAALVAAVSAVGAWTAVLVGAVLGWAGLETTAQDLATSHFARPAVAHPFRHLVHVDRVLATGTAPRHAGLYLVAALAVVAVAGLARRGLPGALVLAAGASGLLLVVVHPVATEAARLALPNWFAVALGLAAVVGGRRTRAVTNA